MINGSGAKVDIFACPCHRYRKRYAHGDHAHMQWKLPQNRYILAELPFVVSLGRQQEAGQNFLDTAPSFLLLRLFVSSIGKSFGHFKIKDRRLPKF